MGRVTYQAEDASPRPALPAFTPPTPDELGTRSKDAGVTVKASLSKRQARWLRDATAAGRVDQDDVIRAMVDVAMALDVDWSTIDKPPLLRAAIADGLQIRRR